MDSFLELAAERYSVRSFSPAPVEDEKLDLILEAAKLAPTAVNYQPQKLYVVKSPKAIARLNELRQLFGAPLAVIVCYDKNISWKNSRNGGHDIGDVDAAIVTTHMMMEALELGIGSCWMGAFSPSEVSGAFNIPENEQPVAILALGYPSDDCRPSDRHQKYRDTAEMVKEI